MKNNITTGVTVLLVTLATAGLYYISYLAIDHGVLGNADSAVRSFTFSEDSERQIAATIGAGITFVGTILAILLAVSALRTSKSQGTISAIGAFKDDFDSFVGELAICRGKLKDVMSASGELANASYNLNHTLFSPQIDERNAEAWEGYHNCRVSFLNSVAEFHKCIAASSNQFLVDTIENNLRGAAGEELKLLQEEVMRCRGEGIEEFTLEVFSQPESSAWEKFKVLERLSGLGCLAAFRTDDEISSEPIEDRVDEQNWVRAVRQEILSMMDVSPRFSGSEIVKLVQYLPCLPAPGVFTEGPIDVYSNEIGDSFITLDSSYYAYNYPSEDRPRILPASNRVHALPVYARILRIYALSLNAEPGLASIKNFLAEMNGESEIVDPLLRGYRQKLANLHALM